jgi:threonyl-tRNA synthetase
VILVAGKREMDEGTVNMRRLGSQEQKPLNLEDALKALKEEAIPPDLRKGR